MTKLLQLLTVITNNVAKYYKLHYICHISTDVKSKHNRFSKFCCKSLSIKVGDIFNMQDRIAKSLKSFIIYNFVCSGCNACYIAETTRHLVARIKEHFGNG